MIDRRFLFICGSDKVSKRWVTAPFSNMRTLKFKANRKMPFLPPPIKFSAAPPSLRLLPNVQYIFHFHMAFLVVEILRSCYVCVLFKNSCNWVLFDQGWTDEKHFRSAWKRESFLRVSSHWALSQFRVYFFFFPNNIPVRVFSLLYERHVSEGKALEHPTWWHLAND